MYVAIFESIDAAFRKEKNLEAIIQARRNTSTA
jgi:hypothetical protein